MKKEYITTEYRNKLKEAQKKRWSKIDRKHGRRSVKNVEWSKSIIERDEFKCKICGSEKNLHAHHIIPWKENEDLRYEFTNGITLCKSCHFKEEWKGKERIGSRKGTKLTEEQKKKLSLAHIGQKAWNKGQYTPPEKERKCKICRIKKEIAEFTPQGKYRTRMCKKCRNKKLSEKRTFLKGKT